MCSAPQFLSLPLPILPPQPGKQQCCLTAQTGMQHHPLYQFCSQFCLMARCKVTKLLAPGRMQWWRHQTHSLKQSFFWASQHYILCLIP